jgi:hypothetical protein
MADRPPLATAMFEFLPQFGFQINRFGMKPGRVEDAQVEGIERGPVAAPERIAAQQHGQCPAAFDAGHFPDQLRQGHLVAVKRIHRLQTGGPAGTVGRLRLQGHRQVQGSRAHDLWHEPIVAHVARRGHLAGKRCS